MSKENSTSAGKTLKRMGKGNGKKTRKDHRKVHVPSCQSKCSRFSVRQVRYVNRKIPMIDGDPSRVVLQGMASEEPDDGAEVSWLSGVFGRSSR